MTRRQFVGVSAAGVAGALLSSCTSPNAPDTSLSSATLRTRPFAPTATIPLGWQRLNLASGRDGYLYVPPSYVATKPAPLMVLLHGAGGSGASWNAAAPQLADAGGFIILAPDSAGRTWDRILGYWGPDVRFIDESLGYVFTHCNIDVDHMALGGFSDGASYALSLGISNGDLFTHLMAFSPGFNASAGRRGTPPIFISHGVQDPILPIDVCSRRIVPALRAAGYDVTYVEFEGVHELPVDVANQAMTWFVPPAPVA